MSKGQTKLAGHILTIAFFVVIVTAWCGYILYQGGALPTVGKKYTVTAIVPTSSLLAPGARVTVAGAEVGEVKSVERAGPLIRGAKLKLEITDDRVTPFPHDSVVQLRTRSLVGENYVSVKIGKSAHAVPDHGQLGLERAEAPVSVDEVLSVLQGKTRDHARTLLRRMGSALTGRGTELNDTIAGLNEFAGRGGEVVAALNQGREDTAAIVDHLGRLMGAVGERGAAVDAIAQRGHVAFRALGDRDAQLAATLRELPSTLVAVRRAASTVGSVSDRATPVVNTLAATVAELEPAVRDLKPAARSGVALVRAIDPARRPLGNTLQEAARAVRRLPAAQTGLEKTLCNLNPTLRYLNPYAADLIQTVAGLGSAANSYDATGHLIRLLPIVNEGSAAGQSPEVLAAMKVLLQSGLFLSSKRTEWHPYMKPGQVGKTVASRDGKPRNAAEWSAMGGKYTRVKADC